MSVFETLSAIDITPAIKKKNGMSYLPWSSAWAMVKERFPNATYSSVKTPEGCIYHTDGRTCWVETSVTIEGETQNETLAVMNYKNAPISYDEIASTDANKSTKRCLVKNLALFGLGLSLWNGEELNDAAKKARAKRKAEEAEQEAEQKKEAAALAAENAKIVELAKVKIASGVSQDSLYAIVAKYTGGKKNPNAIKTIEESKDCYKEISELVTGEDI